jgi:hypothetical protein
VIPTIESDRIHGPGKVFNELVALTNDEIESLSNGDISNQELRMKIKDIF